MWNTWEHFNDINNNFALAVCFVRAHVVCEPLVVREQLKN